MLVSKQDGSITKEIQIPFKEKKSIVMRTKDETTGMTYAYLPSCVYPIIPYFNNYLLMELSADTLYTYSQDHTMKPAIVRVPSVPIYDARSISFTECAHRPLLFHGNSQKRIWISGY